MTPPVATRPELRLPALPVLGVFLLQIVVLAIAGIVIVALTGTIPSDHALFSPYLATAQLAAYGALAGGLVWLARRRTPDARASLGVVRPDSWPAALGLAVLGTFAVLVANQLLEPILHGARSQGLKPAPFPGGAQADIGIALAFLAIVVVAPIVEELFFRGALYAVARRPLGALPTAFGTALIFGAVHLEPRALPVLALLGLVNALVYERCGSILPGMVLHATNNLLAFVLAFAVR